LAHARVPLERVLYLPQDVGEAEATEALEAVHALPPEEKGRVLSLVAALGVEPDRLLASEQPSPGEVRKLLIARGLGQHAWALVLDEPTNHLDLPSLERLEVALREYPGALLLVTHDAHFARQCTTTRWLVRDGRVEDA
ncbi:MAG TPA: ABC transporter ATP-binding protein, partial [Myxococcaceae bacterium]|nr:ABC transporter ATP-binding protein [Myxococcaceae bacterium]